MSGVTDNYGLITVVKGEAYDEEIFNTNNKAIDALLKELDKRAKGLVADKVEDTSNAGYGGVGLIGSICQATLVKDRWYEARYRFTVVSADNGPTINFAFNKSITTDVTVGGTGLNDGSNRYFQGHSIANNSLGVEIKTKFKAPANETVNIKTILARATGVNTFAINSRVLEIFDLGANL